MLNTAVMATYPKKDEHVLVVEQLIAKLEKHKDLFKGPLALTLDQRDELQLVRDALLDLSDIITLRMYTSGGVYGP